jgi:hypothetical protein
MNVRVTEETALAITLGWDTVAKAAGFLFAIDGDEHLADGKRHFTMDGTRTAVKLAKPQDGKPHTYTVEALGIVDTGSVVSPAPAPAPAPTPTASINTWDYGQQLKRRGIGTAKRIIDVTTVSQLLTAWAAIQPGDSIRGHGIRNTGQVRLTQKQLAGFAEVDLSDDCVFTGPTNSLLGSIYFAYNTNVHLYGAHVIGAQLLTYDLVNCDVMDALIQKPRTGGLVVFGIKGPVKNCVFRARVEDSSYGCHPVTGGPYYITSDVATADPHAEEGTGIHGCNIGDSAKWVEDSKFVLDFQDCWTGAAIELSNLRKGALGTGCEFWVRAKGLHQPAQSQVSGNAFQLWGSPSMITDDLVVHYLEVDDAQGRAFEAADLEGPTSGVKVEYARATNTMKNPRLSGSTYRAANGITYGDVK